jgi:hypothetical protein
MRLFYEWGYKQLRKHREELCGDSIVVSRHHDSVTLALSDGLGSGVKANILATLTTQIAMHMLENEMPLSEVVDTLTETLPVCKVRKMAYSTFAIAQFFTHGSARIVEFDSPEAIVLRKRKVLPLAYDERTLGDKKICESVIDLEEGDWVVFVSDGVLNAGIGGAYPLGWGWDHTAKFLEKHAHREISAEELAGKVVETVSELYHGAPGDDVSVVVLKVRKKLVATIMTGPPSDREKDEELIQSFLEHPGKHIVCGGTTAKIVSRYSGHPMEVDLTTMTADVPPIARIEGLDLVSEGILTLTRVNYLLKQGVQKSGVRFQNDGASELIRTMLGVDHTHFIVGQAVNPAHQNPELPHQLGIRAAVVREIIEELQKRGKEATFELI